MLRRTLREQIKRVSDGFDPMNVIRDEQLNRKIPTNAWNTILSPAEVISAPERERERERERRC